MSKHPTHLPLTLEKLLHRCTRSALGILEEAGFLAADDGVRRTHLAAALARWAIERIATARGERVGIRPEVDLPNPNPRPFRRYLEPDVRAVLADAFLLAASDGPQQGITPHHLIEAWCAAEAALPGPHRTPLGAAMLNHASPPQQPDDIDALFDARSLADIILDLRSAASYSTDPFHRELLLGRAQRLQDKLTAS